MFRPPGAAFRAGVASMPRPMRGDGERIASAACRRKRLAPAPPRLLSAAAPIVFRHAGEEVAATVVVVGCGHESIGTDRAEPLAAFELASRSIAHSIRSRRGCFYHTAVRISRVTAQMLAGGQRGLTAGTRLWENSGHERDEVALRVRRSRSRRRQVSLRHHLY